MLSKYHCFVFSSVYSSMLLGLVIANHRWCQRKWTKIQVNIHNLYSKAWITTIIVYLFLENAGSFAEVKTVEYGNPSFLSCPNVGSMETFWCGQTKISRHSSKTGHQPRPSSKWCNIPCTLKRKSFKTFTEAEAEAAEMSGHNDSDSTQSLPINKFRSKEAAK